MNTKTPTTHHTTGSSDRDVLNCNNNITTLKDTTIIENDTTPSNVEDVDDQMNDIDDKTDSTIGSSDQKLQHGTNTAIPIRTIRRNNHHQQRQPPPSDFILPLSMRLLRTIGGVGTCSCCCISTNTTDTNDRHQSQRVKSTSTSIEEEYQAEQDEIRNELKNISFQVDPLYAMMDDDRNHHITRNNYLDNNNDSRNSTTTDASSNDSTNNLHPNGTSSRREVESMMFQPPPYNSNPTPDESSPPSSLLLLHRRQSMIMEKIIIDYHNLCHLYNCNVDIGMITTIRYTLSTLRITSSNFNDAHLLSIVDLLHKYGNGPLSYIKVFDLSRARNRNFNSSANIFFQERSPFYVVPTMSSLSMVSSSYKGPASSSGRGRVMMMNTGFGSHGAIALAKWIQTSQYMTELYIDRNPIGPYGASIIFIACTMNQSLRKLSMRRCHINERGAIMFVQSIITFRQQQLKSLLLQQQQQQQHDENDTTTAPKNTRNGNPQSTSPATMMNVIYCCHLEMIDISANRIGYRGCIAIEVAMNLYHTTYVQLQQYHPNRNVDTGASIKQSPPMSILPVPPPLVIDMEGNLVLQEVMNSITHGLGIILAIIGSIFMMNRVLRSKSSSSSMESSESTTSARHIYSCTIYSVSLIVLYTSSTLYHSFFTLRHTKYVFEVIDKCAIYILIAGSYTPFLQIVLSHHILYSYGLLCFLWILCGLGVTVEFMYPIWKYKGRFSLVMFLCMGWSALICIPEVARIIPAHALHLMTMGGISYTAGVPFFVRNNNLDHAIWHLFVLAGSIFHWCGVYFYVVPLPIH